MKFRKQTPQELPLYVAHINACGCFVVDKNHAKLFMHLSCIHVMYSSLSYYTCDKSNSNILGMDISPANFDQNAHVVDSTEKQQRNHNLNQILCLEIKNAILCMGKPSATFCKIARVVGNAEVHLCPNGRGAATGAN